MPTMVTFRAGRVALVTVLVGLAAACSREQQDWRSAESADTTEAWGRFLEQHPDSELAGQARVRITQLGEQRDWQRADRVATPEAYREFLAQHPTGRWSENARIRIEAFSLGSAPRTAPTTPEEAAAIRAAARVRALHLATSPARAPTSAVAAGPAGATAVVATPAVVSAAAAESVVATPVAVNSAAARSLRAQPGEAAQAAPVEGERAIRLGDAYISTSNTATSSSPPSNPSPSNRSAAGGYGVQLGAFGSEASADRAWQRLQGRFGTELRGLSPRIVVASTDSGQLYRLQAPASGEAQARAICQSLQEQAQPCVPVVPVSR
jgi:cell division septation protein DedD